MKKNSAAHLTKWATITFLSLMVALYHYAFPYIERKPSGFSSVVTQAELSHSFVSKVIDGDTVILNNGEHVRLIGIDAPESRMNQRAEKQSERTHQDLNQILRMGRASKQFLKEFIEGKDVYLEYDASKTDRYGRTLAYLYYPLPEKISQPNKFDVKFSMAEIRGNKYVFVNGTIVRSGYASPLTVLPNVRYAQLFQQLYQEANEHEYGLWAGTKETKIKKELVSQTPQ